MGLIKPDKYVHPNKRKREEVVEEKRNPKRAVESKKAVKEKVEGSAVASSLKSNQQKNAVSEAVQQENITTRLLARIPQIGQIPIYDEMIENGLSDREAIFGMMSKGLALLNVDEGRIDEVKYFEATSTVIETRRTINVDLFNSLKKRFDKFDILSERALGLRVGEALISLADEESGSE